MSNYNFQKTEGTKQLIKIHNGKMLQHKFTKPTSILPINPVALNVKFIPQNSKTDNFKKKLSC